MEFPRDVAAVRLDNALLLFDEFVRATVKHPDAATLRGLERRFAERLQIQPSYWSQIKGRSRQIGERLARQFERLCHKPYGWMDQVNGGGGAAAFGAGPVTPPQDNSADSPLPQDDDERFIVGLVLTYYRRHPQRARTRLLDLLGEVLMPGVGPSAAPSAAPHTAHPLPAASAMAASGGTDPGAANVRTDDDPLSLWRRSQSGVAPLKPRR